MIGPLPESITKDFFLQSGWESVIAECKEKECNRYSSQFSAKAVEAAQAGDADAQEVFRLLSSITSMYLRLDKPDDPFVPMWEDRGQRTSIPTDFDDSHLNLLQEVAAKISDSELRARLADVLWLRRHDFRMGELAVTSYLQSAGILEDPENWTATANRLERALQISTQLGRSAKMFTAVIGRIETLLDKYDGEDPLYLSAKLMRLLLQRKAGDPAKNAVLAEKLALRAEAANDWDRARDYWELNSDWHLRDKDERQARAAKIAAAETHVKNAERHLAGGPPGNMIAASHLQFAIEAYRRVGGMKEKVDELHRRLLECQSRSTGEMATYSSSVEVGELVTITLPECLLERGREGRGPPAE
jgi:hypothetical protein